MGVKHRMCVSAERKADGHAVEISTPPCNTSLPYRCSIGVNGQNDSTATSTFSSQSTNRISTNSSTKNDINVTKVREDDIGDKTTETYDFSTWSSDVYALQLVFVVSLAVAVLFMTVMSLYTYRKNYRSVDLPTNKMNSRSMSIDTSSNDKTETIPQNSVLYSFGWNPEFLQPPKISHQYDNNEDGSNQEKPDDNDYHHIDFTMKSDAGHNFVGDQYGVPTTPAIPENDYEHPWGSRPLQIMSNIRQSFRRGTNAVRNSFFKPQNNLSNPSKAEEVAYMDVKLDHARFMYDSPNVNVIDHSTC